jgi:hypothetical protein
MREVRLTTAQALVRFLAAQHVKRDGIEHRSFGFMRGTWSPRADVKTGKVTRIRGPNQLYDRPSM